MKPSHPCLVATVLAMATGAAPHQEPAATRPGRAHRAAALETARWLGSVAVEVPGGLAWPADPGRSTEPDWTLYAGTPGVVLFHLELDAATGQGPWLEQARRGADALLGWVDTSLEDSPVGLYTGAAGVALALLETWRACDEVRYREGALAVLEHLQAKATRSAAGASLTPVTDVIAGDAGIGFLLLHAARVLDRPRDGALAAELGRGLVARAEPVADGLDWAMSPTFERRMPNFSHGTAGVATFLAALYGETGEEVFLEAARAGARHLLVLAGPSADGFRVHHHSPGGEDLFYLGWCHGPAGTSRLFRTLARVTGEDSWQASERRAARTLLAAGLPDARPDGYWDNVGPCCGAAGVAGFLLDAHLRLGEETLPLVRALTADLLERGTRDAAGLRWEHAEHRVRPEYLSIQTGLMQGAAGVGLWLLRLDAFEQQRGVRVRLPEDRF